MTTVHVTDRAGAQHALEAEEGFRLMEVIRDRGLPIRAECGGSCACATCHVYVDAAWRDRLPPVAAEEGDMLDTAKGLSPASRLSCQIIVTPALDGLAVALAPGSEP